MNKKIISLILCILILLPSVCIASENSLDSILSDTFNQVYTKTPAPTVSSVGGEWAVFGLARSGIPAPDDYFEGYYSFLEDYLKSNNGILHQRKYTEYSRVIIALSAIGKDCENVAGYNLLKPLSDFEKTTRQGINGAIWALIALDSGNYSIPASDTASIQATRQMYVNHILSLQHDDGGWGLSDLSDADITAMALTALSAYRYQPLVSSSITDALNYLSQNQTSSGGFLSQGVENCESAAQVLVCLCELGICVNDERFTKNKVTVFDNLISFYKPKEGFCHTKDSPVSQMTTEQALYALVALERFENNRPSLYTMKMNFVEYINMLTRNANIARLEDGGIQ